MPAMALTEAGTVTHPKSNFNRRQTDRPYYDPDQPRPGARGDRVRVSLCVFPPARGDAASKGQWRPRSVRRRAAGDFRGLQVSPPGPADSSFRVMPRPGRGHY
jgi:hypothetical protein